jgi:hypothetical protein
MKTKTTKLTYTLRVSLLSPASPVSTHVSHVLTHSLSRRGTSTALLPFYTHLPARPLFLFPSSVAYTFLYPLLTYKLNQLNYSTGLNGGRDNKKSTLKVQIINLNP